MVKGEHLWVSIKTSKRDWKGLTITAQHEVLPLITQLSVSSFVRRARFRPRWSHVGISVGHDFGHALLIGQNKLTLPSRNTDVSPLTIINPVYEIKFIVRILYVDYECMQCNLVMSTKQVNFETGNSGKSKSLKTFKIHNKLLICASKIKLAPRIEIIQSNN
jgi:hypothetical protein